MKNHDENDPVWELLKSARKTEAGPFFVRNVLREVRLREDQEVRSGFFSRLASFFAGKPAFAVGAALAACVVLAFGAVYFQPGGGDLDGTIAGEIPVETAGGSADADLALAGEIEAVEYLGQLMAVNDPGQLSDDALVDLLF